jgi:excisionase family DNA binding protein
MKQILSPQECAEILSCSVRTVRRLCEEGRLAAFNLRPGGGLRITGASLENFMRRQILEYQTRSGLNTVPDDDTE